MGLRFLLLLCHRWFGYFRQAIVLTGGDGLHPAKVLYLYRRVAVGGGPVAQLAFVVPTPGPDCAVGLERQALVPTGVDGLDPAQVAHLRLINQPEKGSAVNLYVTSLRNGLLFARLPVYRTFVW
jgi:hypothetical protein